MMADKKNRCYGCGNYPTHVVAVKREGKAVMAYRGCKKHAAEAAKAARAKAGHTAKVTELKGAAR